MEMSSHPRGREFLHYQPEELEEAGEGAEAVTDAAFLWMAPLSSRLLLLEPLAAPLFLR